MSPSAEAAHPVAALGQPTGLALQRASQACVSRSRHGGAHAHRWSAKLSSGHSGSPRSQATTSPRWKRSRRATLLIGLGRSPRATRLRSPAGLIPASCATSSLPRSGGSDASRSARAASMSAHLLPAFGAGAGMSASVLAARTGGTPFSQRSRLRGAARASGRGRRRVPPRCGIGSCSVSWGSSGVSAGEAPTFLRAAFTTTPLATEPRSRDVDTSAGAGPGRRGGAVDPARAWDSQPVLGHGPGAVPVPGQGRRFRWRVRRVRGAVIVAPVASGEHPMTCGGLRVS